MVLSFFRSSFILCLTLLATCASAMDKGQVAPDFDLPGKASNIKLSNLKGKVVYLDFWASWCGPCKQSFPWMNDLQTKYANKGLQVVAINVDQKIDDARGFLKTMPVQFDIGFDGAGTTPKAYGVKGMPTSYLIGGDGKVIDVHFGFRPEDRDALEQKIKQALNIKE